MELSDLMIGDWVFSKHHKKNIQITPYDFFTHGHLPSGKQYFSNDPELVSGRDLEPIPITLEIMEKNFESERNIFGYKDYKLNQIYTLENRGETFSLVRKLNDFLSSTFWICNILYVHELQHALKMCRIKKEMVL